MVNYDLNQEFISQVELPKTSADYPQIRYVDAANIDRALFSRVGWFPAAEGIKRKSIYVLFVGTAEAIEKHAPAIADVCARGNDVMVFEFAGQGRAVVGDFWKMCARSMRCRMALICGRTA